MTCSTLALPDRNGAAPSRLSPDAAFLLQASITVTFLAGSSAPTPLYPLYQASWHFSSATTTIVFGVYALAVLSALLVAGRLSDHVGRRPVLVAACVAQAVAMLVLGTADGVGALVVGRVVQGLATGAAVATVGAGLLDLDRRRGTVANAIAPIVGTASGALGAGLMVHFLPAPTHLVYALLGVIFLLQGVGVVLMRESVSSKAGALASLVPQFGVPPAVRAPMATAVPMLVAVWALGGFYGALGPGLVHRVFALDASLYGGLALAVLAGSGAVAVLGLQRRDAATLMGLGAAALIAGIGVVLLGLATLSVGLFFAGTALAGAGFGAGFQGAIRTVVPFALPHERAGVLSVAYIVSYLAMGLPAVVAGVLVAEGGDLDRIARGFGAVVMGLAALAIARMLAGRRASA